MKALFTLCSALLLAGCSTTEPVAPVTSGPPPLPKVTPRLRAAAVPALRAAALPPPAVAPQGIIRAWTVPFLDADTMQKQVVPGFHVSFVSSTNEEFRSYELSTSTNMVDWELVVKATDNRPTVEVWDFTGRPIGFWKFK